MKVRLKALKSKHLKVMLSLILLQLLTLNAASAYPSGASNSNTAKKNSVNPSLAANALHFSLDQYLNTTENSSDQNIFYDMNRNYAITEHHRAVVNMHFNWSQNENYLYVQAENLYYSISGLDKNLNVGIKKLSWSENLDMFNSPEWQQQLERYKLHPRTGGNLGLFYGLQTPGLFLDIMYSPFFIPNRGPDVEFASGQAVTQSPWFLTPPREVPYDGEIFSTRYELQDPDLNEFLREQTVAVKALAFDSKGLSLNIGYANKPSPRYVTDLDFQANVSNPNVPIDVSIRPRVVRHQLVSADLKYSFSGFSRFSLGYMNENFDNQSFSSESETFMQPLDQSVYTFVYGFETLTYGVTLGGIWRDGGRSRAVGELASALVNQNLNYIYEQAIKLDFSYFRTWGWTINGSVSYDFLQKGMLTSATLQRSVNNALINIGFDALEPINTDDQASFIYQYRNLDRVWAGVSYVF